MIPYLWWVDNSSELFDSIHAKVGDGESTSHELGWLKLPTPCLLC